MIARDRARKRSDAFFGGFVACGPMTTRSNRPTPPWQWYGSSGGVGITTAAAAMAVLTKTGHTGDYTVLVDFDCCDGQRRPRRNTSI